MKLSEIFSKLNRNEVHVLIIIAIALFVMSFRFGDLFFDSRQYIMLILYFHGIVPLSQIPVAYMSTPLIPFLLSFIVPSMMSANLALSCISVTGTVACILMLYNEFISYTKSEQTAFVITIMLICTPIVYYGSLATMYYMYAAMLLFLYRKYKQIATTKIYYMVALLFVFTMVNIMFIVLAVIFILYRVFLQEDVTNRSLS